MKDYLPGRTFCITRNNGEDWISTVFDMRFVTAPQKDDVVVKDEETIQSWKEEFVRQVAMARDSPNRDIPEVQQWRRDMEASRFITGEREILVKRPVR